MNTRFDQKFWVSGFGEKLRIDEMETTHIMNVLKMFINKPSLVVRMLISDVESGSESAVWTNQKSVVSVSIHNITSMTKEEIIEFALNCTLAKAMFDELEVRGVNVENFKKMILNNEL